MNGSLPESGADESGLIAQAKGDQEAFGELYERYVERIHRYIYYRTGSDADAEDLTARTFMKAWEHMGNYDDRGLPFSAWLYRIAHNLVANWHRDRSRRQIISLEDLGQWQINEDGPELRAALAEDDRQELLVLKFVDHLSNAEIGGIMGRSEGAVKSLYHRTLLSLREDIGPSEQPRPAEKLAARWQRVLGRRSGQGDA
jgi:RNA polymerase sigma-70 factor (ECF subfamily)